MRAEPKPAAGWRWTRFGEMVREVRAATNDPSASGLERVVGLEHFDSGSLSLRRWHELAELPDGTSFTRVFRAGQVLFGKRRAYQRKVAVPDFDGVCSSDIVVLEPASDELLPELLPYLIQSDGFIDHALGTSAGSLSPRTKWQELAKYEFLLPPRELQRQIAELGSLLDDEASRLEAARRACVSLERAVLLEVLNTVSPYPDQPIESAADLLLGRQLAPQYRTGSRPIPYVRAANLRDGEVDFGDLNVMDFSEAEERKYSIALGDVLVVEGGDPDAVGAPALVSRLPSGPVCIQKSVIRARARDATLMSSDFLFWFLRAKFLLGEFERMASGTKLHHFTLEKLASVRVPLVERSVQESVVQRCDAVRSVGGSIRLAHERNRHLRRVLLNDLLAGAV